MSCPVFLKNMVKKLKNSTNYSLDRPGKKWIEDLTLERKTAISIAERRRNRFIGILSGCSSEYIDSLRYVILGFGGIVCMTLPSLALTLIPVHNVIEHPEYWYEYPIQVTVIGMPCFVANLVLRSTF